MIRLILSVLLNGLFVYFGAWLLPGVAVVDYKSALIAGIVLGLINWLVKPIVSLISLPITFLTLGLFQLIINAAMVLLASEFVAGFQVDSIWWALGFSLLLSILNSVFGLTDKKQARGAR